MPSRAHRPAVSLKQKKIIKSDQSPSKQSKLVQHAKTMPPKKKSRSIKKEPGAKQYHTLESWNKAHEADPLKQYEKEDFDAGAGRRRGVCLSRRFQAV